MGNTTVTGTMSSSKHKKHKKHKSSKSKARLLPNEIEDGASPDDVARYIERGKCSINDTTGRGASGLMLAARKADKKMIKCLLKLGADATVRDLNGESAFHYVVYKTSNKGGKRAAAALELLKSTCANEMLHKASSSGEAPIKSWLAFTEVARAAALTSPSPKEYSRVAELASLLRDHEEAVTVATPMPSAYQEGEGPDKAWADKLAGAWQDDAGEVGAGFDAFDAQHTMFPGPGPTYGDDAAATDVPGETDEEYRRRIVSGMHDRTSSKHGLGHPGRKEHKRSKMNNEGAEDQATQAKERAEREKEAKAKSDAIIAEQLRMEKILKAKSRADEGETYRTKCAEFFERLAAAAAAGGDTTATICYTDVPWPPGENADDTSLILFGTLTDEGERKKALKKEQFRWHPDRWTGQYLKRVQEQDLERVSDKVTETSKMFNGMTATTSA